MIKNILEIIAWLVNIWSGLPESTKKKIIDIIVESFEHFFKSFFESSQEEDSHG